MSNFSFEKGSAIITFKNTWSIGVIHISADDTVSVQVHCPEGDAIYLGDDYSIDGVTSDELIALADIVKDLPEGAKDDYVAQTIAQALRYFRMKAQL